MEFVYDIEAYDYVLPEERIAQEPADRRDASRLLAVDCKSDSLKDGRFGDVLEYFSPGDLLVVNDTKVFPARLLGRKETGGRVEFLILAYPAKVKPAETKGTNTAQPPWAEVEVVGLLKSSKRPRPGARLFFGPGLEGRLQEILPDGKVRLLLQYAGDLDRLLSQYGNMPLPPYIRRQEGEKGMDRERYQTVFARTTGAVAAPTAGLHFTDDLLARIRERGVAVASVTLHVGYGTFAPVRVRDIREHRIHREYVAVSRQTAQLVNDTKARGGRVWAVGTTTTRTLEFAADEQGVAREREGWCGLYIYPGYRFRVVDNLITNFHLPKSSLLFLVSGLAGRERILAAYQRAVELDYRFFSYGDAMAIIT